MSKWNTEDWEVLVSGATCPICLDGGPHNILVDLETTYLTCGEDGAMRGNCTLVFKRHVVEPYELSPEEAAAFMRDIQRAGRAVQELTGAVKMNYEIHGNTIPHLHIHLFPRYPGDPFEGGPIEPRRIKTSPYAPGEFVAFTKDLQVRLT